jgi:hypothetical protein
MPTANPSDIDNLFGFLAFAGLVIIGILQLRKTAKQEEAPMPTQQANGKASKDYVDSRIQYHELHCSRVDEFIRRLDRIEAKVDRLLEDGR